MDSNSLYYGDNLDILRRYVQDESVDLVYLDPPFKSEQDYNVLFEEHTGDPSEAQIHAFEDTWTWDQTAALAYRETVEAGGDVSRIMRAMYTFLGPSNMMAYISMMAPRLAELKRVLKPTGSVYLHCDPTAGHYLKVLLDAVFSPENFRNEIIWHYYNKFQRSDIPMFARGHDVIFFYTKTLGSDHVFESIYEKRDKPVQQLVRKWNSKTKRIVNVKGPDGKVVYRTVTHRKLDDVWRIPYIVPASNEGLGYQTQKPERLLERIIVASSLEGGTVLDPFCGCGTAVSVAHRLGRRWIGIDITHLAINLIKFRLFDAYREGAEYDVVGEPVDLSGARELVKLRDGRYQFESWSLGLVKARVVGKKKGADKGIDGTLFFHDENAGKTKQIVLSVKSGTVGVKDIRDLRGVVEREEAKIGVLITLEGPTRPMRREAASAGFYESPWNRKKYPVLQILTIEELLEGKGIDYPALLGANVTFRTAPRHVKAHEQLTFEDDIPEEPRELKGN